VFQREQRVRALHRATKEASAKPVDCKKFFPSVGITLSVPCE
jgi:hypothetical protein